ncbi:MAG: carboxymuconolactone decarboxylase family protein [Myxococcota bacterium]
MTTSGNAQLTIHDQDSAPDAAKPILADIAKKYGFTPSLYRIFAGSPAVLKAYLDAAANFADTSLSNQEKQIVLLSAAVENKCHFCVAAHTWTSKGAGVSDADIEAVRKGEAPSDPKLAAIARFTRHLVKERGFGTPEEISTFVEAGFERHQILEVVLGISLKTLSNYVNHLADTPLDEPLQQFA